MEIADIEPAVWRSLVLPLSFDLRRLHLAIQAAFNWWDCHLYEFQIGGLRFGDPQLLEDGGFEGGPRVFDDRAVRLSDFAPASDVSFTYVYDFGDDWRHTIAFEQLLALDAAPKSAGCVAGQRARPPEDVGGVGGYERFLAILADLDDQEHADMLRWCGGHLDPELFDLARVGKDVKNARRPSVRRRLHQPKSSRAQTNPHSGSVGEALVIFGSRRRLVEPSGWMLADA